MRKPNFYDCQSCPQWDDVNGCWSLEPEFCGRSFNAEGEEIDINNPDKEQTDSS